MSQLESFWIASRRLKTKTGSQTASCGLRQNEPKNWRPPWINWRKDHPAILDRLNTIINDLGPAAPKRELHWSDQGKKDWCEFYNSIKSSGSGVVGAIVARTDAHVLRLTMHFTVLDGSALMEPLHLKAAIAFWQYCERSASWIFGQKTGDKAADKIY